MCEACSNLRTWEENNGPGNGRDTGANEAMQLMAKQMEALTKQMAQKEAERLVASYFETLKL